MLSEIKKSVTYLGFSLKHIVAHPGKTIVYKGNPARLTSSAVPWYVCISVIVIGIISWCLSAHLEIPPLSEVARLMVYAPLGNMFGMSFGARTTKKD